MMRDVGLSEGIKRRRILLVDDDRGLRTILSDQLSSAGYKVMTAADGEEAVSTLQQESFDLVVLDLKMPVVNGFAVLKFLKLSKAKAKVIVLTAYADLQTAMESKEFGADDFVGKPYRIEDLLQSFERLLAS